MGSSSLVIADSFTYTPINSPLEVPFYDGINGTLPYGLNDNGLIVGTSSRGAFLYSAGAFTLLTDTSAPSQNLFPIAINNSGQITGYYGDGSGQHLFSDNDGTFYNNLNEPIGRAQ